MQGAPAGLYVPAVHAIQLNEPSELVETAKPGRHKQDDEPAVLLLPAGQARHSVSPDRLHLPGGQAVGARQCQSLIGNY